MTPDPPFFTLREHFAIELPGARAVFTTRRGGHSRGPYASLNLGRHTDDDPEAVAANLAALAAEHGVRLAYGRQVHGARVATVGPAVDGMLLDEADGRATAAPGIAPMVLTADCLPIVIAGAGAVAAIHAGWRGLAEGVIAAGASRVRALGARGPLEAAIGPAAGVCCYEVGDEVAEAFAGAWPDVRQGRRLDLKLIARRQLVSAGVHEVHDIGLCTICGDRDLLYSHRRDHGVTGRQAGLAWLT